VPEPAASWPPTATGSTLRLEVAEFLTPVHARLLSGMLIRTDQATHDIERRSPV
jgi:hypothetical protein